MIMRALLSEIEFLCFLASELLKQRLSFFGRCRRICLGSRFVGEERR
jgi:hypothetical protein